MCYNNNANIYIELIYTDIVDGDLPMRIGAYQDIVQHRDNY